MVFYLNQFTKYYRNKHSLLISSYKSGLIDVLLLITVLFIISISDIVLEKYLDSGDVIGLLLRLGLYTLYLNYRRKLIQEVKEKCEMQRQYFEGDTLKVDILSKKNSLEKYSIQKGSKVLATKPLY